MMFFPQCDNLYQECQRVIQTSKDPLIIQPASLELATIRKKPEDELVSELT